MRDAIRQSSYEQIIASRDTGADRLTASCLTIYRRPGRQAWQNVEAALARPGGRPRRGQHPAVRLTNAGDIKHALVRSQFVKHECASMLTMIPALVLGAA